MISCFNFTRETEVKQASFKMNRWKTVKSTEIENMEPICAGMISQFPKPLPKKMNNVDVILMDNNRKQSQSEVIIKSNRPKNTPKTLPQLSLTCPGEAESEIFLDLPDGSCFNRSALLRFSSRLSTKECQYLGSFLVEGSDQESKTKFVQGQLQRLKNTPSKKRRVVIVVSETGIKVCRPRTKSVLMAHALRRVSLATCDPVQRHFSFLAREPKGNSRLQYCHAFLTDTAQQAEELSRLIGDSFRMAFAQQLQQRGPSTSTATAPSPIATSAAFLDLLCEIQSNRLDNVSVNGNHAHPGISSNSCSSFVNCPDSPGPSGLHRSKRSSPVCTGASSPVPVRCKEQASSSSPRRAAKQSQEMNANDITAAAQRSTTQTGQSSTTSSTFHGTSSERIWAKTVVGNAKHHDPLAERGASAVAGLQVQSSNQHHYHRGSPLTPRRHPPPTSFPTSSTNSSPSTSRGADVGAYSISAELWSPSSASSCEDNTGLMLTSPTEFNSCSQFRDKPPLVKTLETSWTTIERRTEDSTDLDQETTPEVDNGLTRHRSHLNSKVVQSEPVTVALPPTPTMTSKSSFQSHSDDSRSVTSSASSEISTGLANRTASRTSNSENNQPSSEDSQSECSAGSTKRRSNATGSSSGASSVAGATSPPPIPERHDSLTCQEEAEERELRGAPWFQAGIPREIALEILAQEPVGSFMVRESTSKPGCFALSLRVPRDFQPTGIAHYLIMRTHKGFKIKGFMKEFSTLTALITHHSVMPELLPCPLSLSRYNPVFRKQDTSEDLVDIEDPDYNLLADFRKVMSADLKV